jgi:hypothetical protein
LVEEACQRQCQGIIKDGKEKKKKNSRAPEWGGDKSNVVT